MPSTRLNNYEMQQFMQELVTLAERPIVHKRFKLSYEDMYKLVWAKHVRDAFEVIDQDTQAASLLTKSNGAVKLNVSNLVVSVDLSAMLKRVALPFPYSYSSDVKLLRRNDAAAEYDYLFAFAQDLHTASLKLSVVKLFVNHVKAGAKTTAQLRKLWPSVFEIGSQDKHLQQKLKVVGHRSRTPLPAGWTEEHFRVGASITEHLSLCLLLDPASVETKKLNPVRLLDTPLPPHLGWLTRKLHR